MNEGGTGVGFTNGLGVEMSPKLGYFATEFGESLTPKPFSETQP